MAHHESVLTFRAVPSAFRPCGILNLALYCTYRYPFIILSILRHQEKFFSRWVPHQVTQAYCPPLHFSVAKAIQIPAIGAWKVEKPLQHGCLGQNIADGVWVPCRPILAELDVGRRYVSLYRWFLVGLGTGKFTSPVGWEGARSSGQYFIGEDKCKHAFGSEGLGIFLHTLSTPGYMLQSNVHTLSRAISGRNLARQMTKGAGNTLVPQFSVVMQVGGGMYHRDW